MRVRAWSMPFGEQSFHWWVFAKLIMKVVVEVDGTSLDFEEEYSRFPLYWEVGKWRDSE